MGALQRCIPFPQHEVVMRRAPRWQVLGQRRPLAAGRKYVEDRVQKLADVHLAPPPAGLRRRDHRRHQRPLGIGQIAWITQAATVCCAAMFRRPHPAAPLATIRVPEKESQAIPTIQQLSGSALSGDLISTRYPAGATSNSYVANLYLFYAHNLAVFVLRTCCGMPAATRWRMPATTRAPSRIGSVIARFSTPSGTPNWRRLGSRTSGARGRRHRPQIAADAVRVARRPPPVPTPPPPTRRTTFNQCVTVTASRQLELPRSPPSPWQACNRSQ